MYILCLFLAGGDAGGFPGYIYSPISDSASGGECDYPPCSGITQKASAGNGYAAECHSCFYYAALKSCCYYDSQRFFHYDRDFLYSNLYDYGI